MNGRRRRHIRFWRCAFPLAALLLAPTSVQAFPASPLGAKVKGATCQGKAATGKAGPQDHLLVGTPGADVLVGTPGADQLRGRGGNDLICGGGGSDLLAGGAGKDRLDGGGGDDLLLGGAGRDRLAGGKGADHLSGGGGFDECDGNEGSNTLAGCEVVPSTPPPAGDVAVPTGTGPDPEPEKVDSPPVAVDDTVELEENAGATFVDVLSNDTDADADPRTVESATEPAHGNITIDEEGTGLSYEPVASYCNDGEEADTFTYTLNGGSTATVTVRVFCVTTVFADPTLTPAFDPDVSDYTVRCTGDPLEVSGRTAEGTEIAVDGGSPATGSFEATVPLEENQGFGFTMTAGLESRDYFVRCLPSDFPAWNYEQLQQPSHELYVVTPGLSLSGVPAQYVVIFNRDGVPVWWASESPGRMINPTVLADGTIAWWRDNHGFIVHDLSGSILGEINTVSGPTDLHELQQEPDGDYLLISSKVREHIDLTEYGYGADESVLDYIVEEVNPEGELVWSWDTGDHIGLAETGRWWPRINGEIPRDIVHMNAVEPAGEDAVLVSNRHNDAIYKVDKASGEIVWKLGGTWTPKSLQVLKDPEGGYPFGGQHDIRLLPDGTITAYDNNTGQGIPPRAVRYSINEANRTATLVEQVTDPLAPDSFCCGSARRSDDGSWLMSWAANSYVAEYDAAHQPTFRLGFGGTLFSYRAVPVDDNLFGVSSLRAGMDAMHPR